MSAARRFDGRSVFITGGGSGIGQATAIAFAREGACVVIADVDTDTGTRTASSITASGGKAMFIRCDATIETDVVQALEQASAAHGPVRHAHNNVGISRMSNVETCSVEEWNATLALSLTSVFLTMKHEIPMMRKIGGGTIVNTGSMSGKTVSVAVSPAYTAAKAGVLHLTRYTSMAHAGEGIRVNSVSPGLVATPLITRTYSVEEQVQLTREMQSIARAIMPEEVAAAVLYLSSDDAAMITGTDLEISGGRRI